MGRPLGVQGSWVSGFPQSAWVSGQKLGRLMGGVNVVRFIFRVLLALLTLFGKRRNNENVKDDKTCIFPHRLPFSMKISLKRFYLWGYWQGCKGGTVQFSLF